MNNLTSGTQIPALSSAILWMDEGFQHMSAEAKISANEEERVRQRAAKRTQELRGSVRLQKLPNEPSRAITRVWK